MRIIVEAKSAFGVLNAEDKKWYNPANKKMLEDAKRGQAYDIVIADVKEADGKTRKRITEMTLVNLDKPVEVKSHEAAPKQDEIARPVTKKAFVPRKVEPVKEAVDWAAKDRSQLVGGRSHDAVELVAASLQSCTPMPKVLELYREALVGILKLSDEIK
jgi:hypothetical protein